MDALGRRWAARLGGILWEVPYSGNALWFGLRGARASSGETVCGRPHTCGQGPFPAVLFHKNGGNVPTDLSKMHQK